MTIDFIPSNAKEAACLDVVNKLVGPELLEGDVEVGPRWAGDAIEFVCRRGMAATLELVQKNIDRLSPWRDIINQFLSETVDSLRLDYFIEDVIEDLTRDTVISKFCEAGEELMGLISAKAALEHAITICDGKWEWVLREDG
jgi:hypothetical protein